MTYYLRSLVFGAVFAIGATMAFAAEPTGSYRVEGTNPGNGSSYYRGTVTVEHTGETYRVVWVIEGTRYIGTGIGNKNFLSVSYRSGNETGLALYGEDGGNWVGVWAYAGGQKMGQERWLRQ